MRVPYAPLNEKEFLAQLNQDIGDIVALGDGLGDINIFRRHRLSKGSGAFSNLLLRYGKRILPYLKKILWPAAKEFGQDVIGDVTSGDAIKTSLKKRGRQALAKVGKKILTGKGKSRKSLKRKCKKQKTTRRAAIRKHRGGRRRRKAVSTTKKLRSDRRKKRSQATGVGGKAKK